MRRSVKRPATARPKSARGVRVPPIRGPIRTPRGIPQFQIVATKRRRPKATNIGGGIGFNAPHNLGPSESVRLNNNNNNNMPRNWPRVPNLATGDPVHILANQLIQKRTIRGGRVTYANVKNILNNYAKRQNWIGTVFDPVISHPALVKKHYFLKLHPNKFPSNNAEVREKRIALLKLAEFMVKKLEYELAQEKRRRHLS
jgi:hypothetical protein